MRRDWIRKLRRRLRRFFVAGPDNPRADEPRDPYGALKARILRTHGRLKQARALQERDEIITALTGEVDRALDEYHRRLVEEHLERLYRKRANQRSSE